jgi:hypothetical protein
MQGTENVKVIVGFVLDLTADAQKALADGKFQFKDSFLFVDNAAQVPKAVRSAAKFWEEFQDIDEAEEADIIQFVIDRLHCEKEKAQRVIVHSFKTAIAVADLVAEGIDLAKVIKAA